MKRNALSLVTILVLIVAAIITRTIIISQIFQLDSDFSYSAQLSSVDNVYDPVKKRFTEEINTETKFSYETIETKNDIQLIKNIYQIKKRATNETLFTESRLYGIDSKTSKHTIGYGDRQRYGYLFGPRNNKKENFTYWHVNYNEPAFMEFKREEIINGLKTYRYECYYTADQTENLTKLDGVPEKYGVNLSIYLQLWVDPVTGWLIKYEDHTEGWFYDINSKEKLYPWNEFRNQYSDESIVYHVNHVKNMHSKLFFFQVVFPVTTILIFIIVLVIIFLSKKFHFKRLRPAYFATLILLVGFSLSFFAYFDLNKKESDREWQSFDANYKKFHDALQMELKRNKDALEFLRFQTVVNGVPTRKHFKELSNYWLKSLTRIQAIEWIPEVKLAERKSFEKKARKDGLRGFFINERDMDGNVIPALDKKTYYPVYYAEPHAINQSALGYDLGSNTSRLEALVKSRKKGVILSTEPITLDREIKSQKSIIVFNPVWDEKTGLFMGYYNVVIRIRDFIEAMITRYGFSNQHGIEIFDITRNLKTLLFTNVQNTNDNNETNRSRSFTFLNRIWDIEFTMQSRNTFWEPLLLLILGCCITIISAIFGYRVLADNKKELIKLNEKLAGNQKLLKIQAKKLEKSNSELNTALKEIQNKQNELIEVENLKSVRELAASVAHEFGQPLQALSITIDILKGGGDVNKQIPNFMKMVNRFVELTDNLRNITSLSKKEYLDTKILDLDASSTNGHSSDKILVVDDEELVVELLVEMFKTRDIECDGALGGKEALELLKSNHYKTIISDVSMPEMSGPEFFKNVKARGITSTFIFITGYEMPEELEKVVAQADGLLNKPVSFENLFNLLQKFEVAKI